MVRNYILSVVVLLLLASTQSFAQRVGDPGVTFDESKFDPDYPQMQEWIKAGVEGGIPLRSESPVVRTISATNSAGIIAAMEFVQSQGGGQLVLENGTYDIDAQIQMRDNVRIVGESKDGVILNITMTTPANEQRQAFVFGVQNAGIENLTIQGAYGTPNPYSMTNDKPTFMVNTVSFNSNSRNNWLDNVNILNSGHHAVTSWNSRHFTIRDCYIDGSWNKGGGGRGYVQFAGKYTLMYNTVVKNLRHIVIQGQHSEFNVMYKNEVEQDFNFHNADAGSNLVEQNISRLPAGLPSGWRPMMGPWSVQHSNPGPNSAIYKNDCIEYNNGGQVIFSDPNLVYIPARFQGNNPFDTSTNTPIGGTFYPVNNVTSEEVNATGVTLTPETVRFRGIGETIRLHERIMPYFTSNKSVTWSSNDESVATVDEDGFVTAEGIGTARITVTTEDGSFTANTIVNLDDGERRYTETFELIDLSEDQLLEDFTFTGDSGYDWTVNGQFMLQNNVNNTQGVATDNGILLESSTISDGIGSFSVECKNEGNEGSLHTIKLLVNGVEVGSSTTSSTEETYTFAVDNIDIGGNVTLALEIEGETISIDNVIWTPHFDYVETFENMTLEDWGSETYTGNHGFNWQVVARGESERFGANSGKSIMFANSTVGVKSSLISGGISSFSVDCINLFVDANAPRTLDLIINGEVIASITQDGQEAYTFDVDNINIEGDFTLELRNSSSGGISVNNIIGINNISWNSYNLPPVESYAFTETFENLSGSGEGEETFVGDDGYSWSVNATRSSGDLDSGKNIHFTSGVTGIESGQIPDGISSFSVECKNLDPEGSEGKIELLINDKVVGSKRHTGTENYTFKVNNLNIEGDFTLALRNASEGDPNTNAIAVDNISWNSYSGPPVRRNYTESLHRLTENSGTSVNRTFTNLDNGYSWDLNGTISVGNFNQFRRDLIFRSGTTGVKSSNPIPGGIKSFTMDVRNVGDIGNERKIEVLVNDDVIETIENVSFGRYQISVDDINIEGDFTLAIRNASNTNNRNEINVKYISWTDYSGPGNDDPTLNVVNVEAFENLRMYPNPSSDGTFRLSLPNVQSQEVDVNIYSMTGKEVYNQKLQVTNQKNIDVQSYSLNSGLYIVSVEQNGLSHKLKLVVK